VLGLKFSLPKKQIDPNTKNPNAGRKPFFNWISADATIATARGGSGGLALWRRDISL
jgi:hypothetical protein